MYEMYFCLKTFEVKVYTLYLIDDIYLSMETYVGSFYFRSIMYFKTLEIQKLTMFV